MFRGVERSLSALEACFSTLSVVTIVGLQGCIVNPSLLVENRADRCTMRSLV
jgi:hypothetical protein